MILFFRRLLQRVVAGFCSLTLYFRSVGLYCAPWIRSMISQIQFSFGDQQQIHIPSFSFSSDSGVICLLSKQSGSWISLGKLNGKANKPLQIFPILHLFCSSKSFFLFFARTLYCGLNRWLISMFVEDFNQDCKNLQCLKKQTTTTKLHFQKFESKERFGLVTLEYQGWTAVGKVTALGVNLDLLNLQKK